MANLRPQHLADLTASRLSDATIRGLGFYSATREEAATVLGFDPGSDCLAFPFPSLDGSKPFVRFKPDTPFVRADGKASKYLSSKDADNRLFIPATTRKALADPDVSLLVTEGEKKAAKADQDGFPCVGLTGVACWRQKPRDATGKKVEDAPGEPIPDLDAIAWRGRTVYAAFDSDASRKAEVKRERWALRCELVRRGAEVRVMYLPDGDGGAKCGLDDFLVAHGPEALRELLNAAPVLDWSQRAAEVLELPEGDARDEALRSVVEDLVADRGVDPLTRNRVRKTLVDARVVPAKTFDDLVKFYGGRDGCAERESEQPRLTAKSPNLVDLVDTPEGVAFLLKEGDKLTVAATVESDDGPVAPPPREKIPFPLVKPEEVTRYYHADSDARLFDDLVEYHRNIADLPEGWYLLLAVWDVHTWLLEGVNFSPIIVFFAVPERGKSRTLKGMANVAYRAITTETLREANVFRHAERFGGTIAFDVMNLWRKAERKDSEDSILQRFERGATVTRVIRPEAGPFLDTHYYSIFGPTVVATNEPLHHILDTRALTLTMAETDRTFADDVTPESALPLRARLTAFRARHLGRRLPRAEKALRGRLGDITRPLVQIVRLVRPEAEERLLALFADLDGERRREKAETVDGVVVAAVAACVDDLLPDGRLKVSVVVEKINEGRSEERRLSPQYVGKRLRALGFKKGTERSSGSTILHDLELLERLQVKYGLVEGVCTVAEMPHLPRMPRTPQNAENLPLASGMLNGKSADNESTCHGTCRAVEGEMVGVEGDFGECGKCGKLTTPLTLVGEAYTEEAARLLAWGEDNGWPRLPVGRAWLAEGEESWRKFAGFTEPHRLAEALQAIAERRQLE